VRQARDVYRPVLSKAYGKRDPLTAFSVMNSTNAGVLPVELYLPRAGGDGEGAGGVFGAGITTIGGCICRAAVIELAIAVATPTSS
jgi:hypothetical protein